MAHFPSYLELCGECDLPLFEKWARSEVKESVHAIKHFRYHNGKKLVHQIIENGWSSWLEFILDFSYENEAFEEVVEMESEQKETLAHYIVLYAQKNVEEMLLILERASGELGRVDCKMKTPLYYAVCLNRIGCIKILASHFSGKRDHNGLSSIDLAALRRNVIALKLISQEMSWVDFSIHHKSRLLLCACISGSKECIRYITEEMAVNPAAIIDAKSGRNCLHWAAQTNCDVSHLLSIPGVNQLSNKGDKARRTPLHVAAKYGNGALCSLLIANQANPLAVDAKNLTPIHYACQNHEDSLSVLLKYIRKMDFPLDYTPTRTPKMPCLHIVCQKGSLQNLTILLQIIGDKLKGNYLDRYRHSVLYYCAASDSPAMFLRVAKQMHKLGITYRIDKDPGVIREMVSHNWGEYFFDLLHSICDEEAYQQAINTPNAKGVYPIHIATITRAIPFVLKHLEQIPEWQDGKGNTCAHYACYFNQVDVLSFIVGYHPNCLTWLNHENHTPIHLAIANGSFDVLLDHQEAFEQHITRKDRYGNDALLLTANRLHHQMISFFESRKVPKIKNNNGETLLHRIARTNSISKDLFSLIIDSNIDLIHEVDIYGRCPLMVLCQYHQDIQLLALMLDANANPNQADLQGNTALHYCSYYNNYSYYKHFSSDDEPLLRVNGKGRSVLDVAAFCNSKEIVKDISSNIRIQQLETDQYIDFGGRSPVHAAALQGNLDCIEMMSDLFKLNASDAKGRTPLYLLLLRRQKADILRFLRLGAEPTPNETVIMMKYGWKGVMKKDVGYIIGDDFEFDFSDDEINTTDNSRPHTEMKEQIDTRAEAEEPFSEVVPEPNLVENEASNETENSVEHRIRLEGLNDEQRNLVDDVQLRISLLERGNTMLGNGTSSYFDWSLSRMALEKEIRTVQCNRHQIAVQHEKHEESLLLMEKELIDLQTKILRLQNKITEEQSAHNNAQKRLQSVNNVLLRLEELNKKADDILREGEQNHVKFTKLRREKDLENMDTTDIRLLLWEMGLYSYWEIFREQQLDGEFVVHAEEPWLLELGMSYKDCAQFFYHRERISRDNSEGICACKICGSRTPEQTIALLQEYNIHLSHQVTKEKNYLAIHFLYLNSFSDFGKSPKESYTLRLQFEVWRQIHQHAFLGKKYKSSTRVSFSSICVWERVLLVLMCLWFFLSLQIL